MILLFAILMFFPASVRSNWASNVQTSPNTNDRVENGIVFNEVSKIFRTEKFIRVEFLAPFPTYEFSMKLDIEKKMLHQLSETPLFCPLNFSSLCLSARSI